MIGPMPKESSAASPYPLHIEESGLNAWPALQTNLYDGWVLRFANGYTKRANSITPVYAGSLPLIEKVGQCEAIYNKHQQPIIFRLPSFHPDSAALDAILADRGYGLVDETSVQVADVAEAMYEENESIQNMMYPSAWLPTYHRLDQAHNDSDTHEKLLQNIVGETAYLVLMDSPSVLAQRETVACGLGICQGHYVGLYDIVVGEDHRRKGYGAQLVEALLNWGIERQGAHYAYLSVVAENRPAINLYARFGFTELYRYHYRVKRVS